MKIDKTICVSCGMCVAGFYNDKKCPGYAIAFNPIDGLRIDDGKCISCGLCADLCALGAITGEKK